MRYKIWNWILSVTGHETGMALKWKTLWIIRAVLFPVECLAGTNPLIWQQVERIGRGK